MRLVVRVFGFEVLAIEQGEADAQADDWSLGGTTASVGFQVDDLPQREGYDWGEDQ